MVEKNPDPETTLLQYLRDTCTLHCAFTCRIKHTLAVEAANRKLFKNPQNPYITFYQHALQQLSYNTHDLEPKEHLPDTKLRC